MADKLPEVSFPTVPKLEEEKVGIPPHEHSSLTAKNVKVTNNYILVNDGTTNRILIDGPTGKIKVSRATFDVLTTGNVNLIMSSDFSFVKETWLQMHPQHTDRWTQSDTYVDVVGSVNSIDFADWPDHSWFFEMIGFTDDGTGFWQLVNTTTGVAVANSEISTTATLSTRVRTSAALTKPTGVNGMKIQHRQTGGAGTGFVNSVMSRSVFRIV